MKEEQSIIMKVGPWLWSLIIVFLCIAAGQMSLLDYCTFIRPIQYVLILFCFIPFIFAQYYFVKNKLYRISFKNPAHSIFSFYILFGLYILISIFFISSNQIYYWSDRYIQHTKNIWIVRYLIFILILQSGLIIINNFQSLKKPLYKTIRLSGVFFLIYFFYNFLNDRGFYIRPGFIFRGNGMAILGATFLKVEIALLLFAEEKIKKYAKLFFCLYTLQIVCVVSTAYYRQASLGLLSCVGIYIIMKHGFNIKRIFPRVLLLLLTSFMLMKINPSTLKKITSTNSLGAKHYTQRDCSSVYYDNNSKSYKLSFHQYSERSMFLLVSFLCWQYNLSFGYGYGCFSIAPHNIVFEILASLGTVGMVLFLSPIIVYVFYCGRFGIDRKKVFIGLIFLMTMLQNYYTGTYVFNPYLYWLLAFGFLDNKIAINT